MTESYQIELQEVNRPYVRSLGVVLAREFPQCDFSYKWTNLTSVIGVSGGINAPGPAWTTEKGEALTVKTKERALQILNVVNAEIERAKNLN